jgi:DNA repair exonuclease SbcCD nuclease subunit
MKFAHVSDIHLGHSPSGMMFREEDFKNAFEYTINKIISENVDFVILSGDLFDKSKPTPKTISDAIHTLTQLKNNNIPVIIIEGNHEQNKNKSPVQLLYELGLVELIGLYPNKFKGAHINHQEVNNTGAYYNYAVIDNIEIWGLQYYPRSKHNTVFEKYPHGLLEFVNPQGDYNILTLHQTIGGVYDNPIYNEIAEVHTSQLPKDYDYYALGHIHEYAKKQLTNSMLIYPSSLERCDYGDYNITITYHDDLKVNHHKEKQKGFIIVNNKKDEFITTPARDIIKITVKGVENEVMRKLDEIKSTLPAGCLTDVSIIPPEVGGVSVEKLDKLFMSWKKSGVICNYKYNILNPKKTITIKNKKLNFNDFLSKLNKAYPDIIGLIDEKIEACSSINELERRNIIPEIGEELLKIKTD